MTKYNGYANYETWDVALWIDNDEYSQNYWTDTALDILSSASDSDGAMYELATRLESELTDLESIGIVIPNCMYSDLLTHALGMVDWREIADNMIDAILSESHPDDYEFEF